MTTSTPTLRPYQWDGVEFLCEGERVILADEPGLGKTAQLLTAAEGRTLVVSPAMLEDVWADEARIWRPDLDLTWVSYSSLCDRIADAKGRKTVPVPKPRPEYREHWDTVILDESHYIKERKTRWTGAVQDLSTDRVFMATGTALPNWAYEIYTSLCIMFPEDVKPKGWLGSYWRWAGEWFQVTANRHNAQARDIGDLQGGLTWDDFAEGNRLKGRWLRRLRDEVLPDLPPMTQQVIQLAMTPEQAKVYKLVKKELYARVEETGNEIISWSKSGVHTKLMKLCTGVEAEDEEYTSFGCKISAVRELMVGRTHPTLLFTAYRSTCRKTAGALEADGFRVGQISGDYSVSDRKAAAKAFQKGELDVLVGTLGTISEGLTLTAADTCIFIERDPRPSKNEQALRRIHRMGQDRPCLSIDLVTLGTVDVEMVKWLREKSDHQMAAMTAFDLLQAA